VIAADAQPDRRVLFLAPTARDGANATGLLVQRGIRVDVCRSFGELLREIAAGAGAVLLPEEATTPGHNAALRRLLDEQPPWSDLPILVLTRPGSESAESIDAVRMLGNVTLLERPLRGATLLSAVRTSLRARDRQYQIREHLARHVASERALRLADQRKDEFLATLGHELRNPLSPLLTAVQLLTTAGVTDPVALRVSAMMERQIRHLVRLVDDLLEVSRITRGLVRIQPEDLDLATIVQAAVDTSRPLLDGGKHNVDVEFPRERVIVSGDAVRLTQVFANLLTNAAKYSEPGGPIAIRLRIQDDRAVVSVRDSGIGIPPDQLTAVFDMFTQVDRSNRRAQGGLGIGLTLVRSLVALHDGRVEARSEGLGRGSEFVVTLPRVVGRAIDSPAAQPPLQPFPRRRVLVVDDNRDAGEMLGELLTALGAIVTVVDSGRAALAALDSFEPEAILLDIGMPGMDGYEVARRIRASAGHHDVLLIALTGWGQEADRRRTVAAGFDHHVIKPPDVERLRQLLLASPPGTVGVRSRPQ
jgi:signal transduction histidine kinase/CheY-like chemotaxis protein